jgi:hypothetical protein
VKAAQKFHIRTIQPEYAPERPRKALHLFHRGRENRIDAKRFPDAPYRAQATYAATLARLEKSRGARLCANDGARSVADEQKSDAAPHSRGSLWISRGER